MELEPHRTSLLRAAQQDQLDAEVGPVPVAVPVEPSLASVPLVGPDRTARLAAEAVRPLHRADLGQVTGAEVAETELTRQPDTAGLFLDEADALFGKRTDVRDAHDRYADIDVTPTDGCGSAPPSP